MGGLRTNANDFRGIVSDHLIVEWETSRVYKFGTMVGFVLDSLSEDGREGVNPVQLVVGDDHEQWEKGFLDASEVQNKMIIMRHQILSCRVPVVRSFFIL